MEIRRDRYLNLLISKKHNGLIKVITGMRRCGKSYLLFKLFKGHLLSEKIGEDHIIEIAFDAFENKQYRDPNKLYPYLKGQISDQGMYYVLLDEVQLLDDFEAILNSLTRMNNVDVYVTGSNARFLSRDIATEFRGRGEAFFVPPLSLKETMDGLALPFEEALSLYLSYGGLPYAALLSSPEEKEAYLQSLFRETYVRNLLERNAIRREDSFRRLLSVAASSVGSCLSPSRIEKTFRSELHSPYSRETIGRHLRLMEDAFLIQEATRVDLRGRKAISSSSKYYFGDLGILNAALQGKRLGFGHAMENLVYLALRKRGWTVHVGNIALSKERQGDPRYAEVDFLLEKPGRRAYAQLFAGIPGEKDEERELRPLLHVPDSFPKAFLSMDPRAPSYDDHGILHLSLRDFLLEGDGLGF